jgi:hypothetical protein
MAAMLVCSTISNSAQALPPGQAWYYGAGDSSCGTWLANRKEGNWYTDGQWVLGWLSAAGYYDVRGDLRETDSDAVDAWLDKYCREHPLNTIKAAAASLVDELPKTK